MIQKLRFLLPSKGTLGNNENIYPSPKRSDTGNYIACHPKLRSESLLHMSNFPECMYH